MYRLQTDILGLFPSLHDVDKALHYQNKYISFFVEKARLTSSQCSKNILLIPESKNPKCIYPEMRINSNIKIIEPFFQ